MTTSTENPKSNGGSINAENVISKAENVAFKGNGLDLKSRTSKTEKSHSVLFEK